MKAVLISTFIILLMTGCAKRPISKAIINNFTNCFGAKNSNIRSLINIDGYYLMYDFLDRRIRGTEKYYKDTFDINIIFYEDGTLIYNFFSLSGYPEDIPGYLKKVVQNGYQDEFYSGFYWGVYRIDGDTIKAQYINHTNGLAPWDAREEWFKVIDRKTVVCVYARMIGEKMTEVEVANYKESISKYTPGRFIPLEVIPPPNCWLKKEKWIWCK